MKPISKIRLMNFTWLICSLLLLAACATPTPVSTEDLIEQRATARWEALLGGDLAGAYEYLSPGYRSSVSSLQYQRTVLMKKVRWTDASYIESECEGMTCNVRISLGYSVYGALPGVKSFDGIQTIDEIWIFTDGNWYLVPEE